MLSEIQFHVFVNSFLLLLTDRKQVTPGMVTSPLNHLKTENKCPERLKTWILCP
jgi:hypothetical protein